MAQLVRRLERVVRVDQVGRGDVGAAGDMAEATIAGAALAPVLLRAQGVGEPGARNMALIEVRPARHHRVRPVGAGQEMGGGVEGDDSGIGQIGGQPGGFDLESGVGLGRRQGVGSRTRREIVLGRPGGGNAALPPFLGSIEAGKGWTGNCAERQHPVF